MKYYDEVYPATLVFISFSGYGGYASHQMVKNLKNKAPNLKPLVFDFMSTRPDLSKLDNVLGVLSFKTSVFKCHIDELERQITEEGLGNVFASPKEKLQKRGWAMHLLLSKKKYRGGAGQCTCFFFLFFFLFFFVVYFFCFVFFYKCI